MTLGKKMYVENMGWGEPFGKNTKGKELWIGTVGRWWPEGI